MRIITPGTPKTPVVEHEAWCPECRCKFAFTEDDVRKEEINPTEALQRRVVTIKCPQQGCGHGIRIKLP